MFRLEETKSLEAPESMKSAEFFRAPQDFIEWLRSGFIAAFHDKALCRVSPPTIGVAEMWRQFGSREFFQSGGGTPGLILVTNTVDAAVTLARFVESATDDLLAQVGGDVGPVLDNAMIHIEHVEEIVRSRIGVHRTKPLVSRS